VQDLDRAWPVRKPVAGVKDTWRMDVPMDMVTPYHSQEQLNGTAQDHRPSGFWTGLPSREVVTLEIEQVLRSTKRERKTMSAERSMLGQIGGYVVMIYGMVIGLYLIMIAARGH
jgi:hypothetical protein